MVNHLLNMFFNKIAADDEVINFSALARRRWVESQAKRLAAGTKVLDAGAGECQFSPYFAHCDYKTQDFAGYAGTASGPLTEQWRYGRIDYVCDIENIPVRDGSFEVVLCTEVLEHLPRPIEALKELTRVLAPGGTLLLTAPLACALHQQPYHFYGGFTPHFYRKFLTEFGADIVELTPIGGLMKHTAQEVHRVGRLLESRAPGQLSLFLKYLLLSRLPKFMAGIDDAVFAEEFTVGYFVEARKRARTVTDLPDHVVA